MNTGDNEWTEQKTIRVFVYRVIERKQQKNKVYCKIRKGDHDEKIANSNRR